MESHRRKSKTASDPSRTDQLSALRNTTRLRTITASRKRRSRSHRCTRIRWNRLDRQHKNHLQKMQSTTWSCSFTSKNAKNKTRKSHESRQNKTMVKTIHKKLQDNPHARPAVRRQGLTPFPGGWWLAPPGPTAISPRLFPQDKTVFLERR